MISHLRRACQLVGSIVFLFHAAAFGVTPAEDLLPNSTCLFVSFPDMDAFEVAFSETQLGELTDDPVMKPFTDDLTAQLRDRFGKTDFQLGIKWEDLKDLYAGETCLARVQPGNKKGEHAVVLLVDVTDRDQQVQKLRQTVAKTLTDRDATQRKETIGDAAVTTYQLPKKRGELQSREVFFTVIKDQLLVTNHRALATQIIGRATGTKIGSPATDEPALSSDQDFAHVKTEVAKSSGGMVPHVRWFVDPFQYAQVIRASRSLRTRRGNFAQTLADQGFTAIRALGGHINLSTADHDALHRTLIYAPPVTDQPTRFSGAARMLNFPATSHLPIPYWIPRDVATFMSFNWNVLSGFNYSMSLIDAIADSPGFVEDVLVSFETDKTGPMINIRKALLAHLDEHIVTFSDFNLPITTKSERLMVAVRVKDEKAVEDALRQLWKSDPQAEEAMIEGHVVWEIIPENEIDLDSIELPTIPVPGNESGLGGTEGDEIKLPNAAMTVSRGPDKEAPPYLLISTDVGLLKEVLSKRPAFNSLDAAADFQIVNTLLDNLGSGKDSFRFFSRTDEEYRSAYEMIRRGKMPESESMLGRVLNRLLGPEEDDVLRKPEIDGSKLPDYQVVRRYLGPAGMFVTPRDDGWMATGIMISKQKLIDKDAAAGANLTRLPNPNRLQ